jgi:hypothetical protein
VNLLRELIAVGRELAEEIRGLRSELGARRRRRIADAAPAKLDTVIGVAGIPTPIKADTITEIERVREGLVYGWREGGPPRPLPPGYDETLPRLAWGPKIPELLANGMTATELFDAVDEVADLVEAGVIPPTDWSPSKVFSGFLGGFRVKHAQWKRDRLAADRARRELQAAIGNEDEAANNGTPLSFETADAARRRFAGDGA